MKPVTHDPFLEVSPFESDGGNLIGRDPREIPSTEWAKFKPDALVGMKAIRAKCKDCSHNDTEVRKCASTDCPLWHLRMGAIPRGLQKVRGVGGKKK